MRWSRRGPTKAARSSPDRVRADQAVHRRGQASADQQQRLRETLLYLRDMKGGREALEATGYKGFVAPAPDVETATIVWLGL